ncbi:MAG: thioredoxin [Clostridia bacterium]|nr:thioredoxin [Clostridia bacterium]
MPKFITTDNFEETVKNSAKPVLIDFYADWCGPCKMIAPEIEELESEMGDKAVFCKINVDDAESIALSLGIDAIPTIIIFKNGSEAARSVGLVSKDQLAAKLGELL